MYKLREECAICGGKEFSTILSYGKVPLAGYFPSKAEIDKEELFDLNVLFCDNCKLVQTDSIIDGESLFRDYRYMSSIGLQGHFNEVAKMYKDKYNLSEDSLVTEIGSNDGVLLFPLKELGVLATGFEPATNIARIAEDKGCDVINDFFSEQTAKSYMARNKEDLIISNNCFAHIDDIHSIVKGVKYALKKDGHFVIEVSYLRDLIEKLQYDNIYHEHIYYYSLTALYNLFSAHGMTIVDYDFIPIHSGSIRVYVQNDRVDMPDKVVELLREEERIGLTSKEFFADFGDKVRNHARMIKRNILEMLNGGGRVIGYGASGRANMLCNIAGLTDEHIDIIIDESPERKGRFIAGKKIPIVGPEHIPVDDCYVVIFAWNFADMIAKKLNNKHVVTFFPEGSIRYV